MTKKTHRKRRSSRGVLFVISLLFLSSGLLRLGDGTGKAIAREVSAIAAQSNEPAAPALCQSSDGLPELFADLADREKRIESMESAITDRMQALGVAEAAYASNIANLIAAEEALSRTMALSETAAEDDISKLTAVYENMKPKDAAALFEEMNPEFSAGFMSRMRTDAAAAIMAGLEPQTAYSISVVLAGQNADAPTE